MAEQGVPNKRFSEQMRHHRKAWDDPSSEEYRLRKSYPGKEAREWVCENDDCINFMPYPSHETYWLCPECARVAPSIIDYYTHAPYKVSRAFIPPPGMESTPATGNLFGWPTTGAPSKEETAGRIGLGFCRVGKEPTATAKIDRGRGAHRRRPARGAY